jgi:adenylate cyclase
MSVLRARYYWDQLKKRKVVRVALVYIIVALVALLVGEVVFDDLALPSWSLTLLFVLVLLGFPVALFLSWVYGGTPEGVRKDSAGHIESVTDLESYREDAPSVAVLPFEDLSEARDQEYFSEGVAEEILDYLRKIPGLRVASRMTAFQLDPQESDPGDVGKKLKVQAELKGGVRQSGDKLHIEVELIDTRDGTLLWSQQYDRPLQEIFVTQKKIVNAVTKSLKVPVKLKAKEKKRRPDPKAYDLFLHGQSCFGKHTIQENVYARQLFKRTIDIEPEFGRAWAALAYTYSYSYMYFNATDVNLAEAERTSAQALKYAPHLAESHVSSGIALCMRQNYKKAEAEFEKAINLDPKNFRAWYFFGRAKVQEGDLGRALSLFERASRVRPEDFQSVLLQAQLYTSLDQKDKALEVTRQGIKRVRDLLEINPDDDRALNMGAFALLRLGRAEEAAKWMRASMKNAPMDSIIQYNGACFFSLAGDVEHALDCLENCLIKVGNINREWLVHDSDIDNIRNHPRYEEIVRSFPE